MANREQYQRITTRTTSVVSGGGPHHYYEDDTAAAVIRNYGFPPEQVKNYHQVPEHGCDTCRRLSPLRRSQSGGGGPDLYGSHQEAPESRLGPQFHVYTQRARGTQFRCGTSNPGSRNGSPIGNNNSSNPSSRPSSTLPRPHQRARSPPAPPATIRDLQKSGKRHADPTATGRLSRDSAKLIIAIHSAHNVAHLSASHELLVRARLGQFEGLTGVLVNRSGSSPSPLPIPQPQEGDLTKKMQSTPEGSNIEGVFWEEAFELPMHGSDGLPLEIDLIDATTNRVEGSIRMPARHMDTHPEGAVEEVPFVVPTQSKLPPRHHLIRGDTPSAVGGPLLRLSWRIEGLNEAITGSRASHRSSSQHHAATIDLSSPRGGESRSHSHHDGSDAYVDDCDSDGSSVSCGGFPAHWLGIATGKVCHTIKDDNNSKNHGGLLERGRSVVRRLADEVEEEEEDEKNKTADSNKSRDQVVLVEEEEVERLPFEVALTLKVKSFFGSTTKRCLPCWRLTAATGTQLRMGPNVDAAWTASLTLVTTSRFVLLSFHDHDRNVRRGSESEENQGVGDEDDDYIAARILDLAQMPLAGEDQNLEVFQQPQVYPRPLTGDDKQRRQNSDKAGMPVEDTSFLANCSWTCDAVVQEETSSSTDPKGDVSLCLVVSRAFDLTDTDSLAVKHPLVRVSTGNFQASTAGPTTDGGGGGHRTIVGRTLLAVDQYQSPASGAHVPTTLNPVWEQEIRFPEFSHGNSVDFMVMRPGNSSGSEETPSSFSSVSCATLQLNQKEGNCVLLLHCPRASTTKCLGELLVSWSTRPLVQRPAPQQEELQMREVESVETEKNKSLLHSSAANQSQEETTNAQNDIAHHEAELEEVSTPDKEAQMNRELQEEEEERKQKVADQLLRKQQQLAEQLRQKLADEVEQQRLRNLERQRKEEEEAEAKKREEAKREEEEGKAKREEEEASRARAAAESGQEEEEDKDSSPRLSSVIARLSSITAADSTQHQEDTEDQGATEDTEEAAARVSPSQQQQQQDDVARGESEEGATELKKEVYTTEAERREFIALRLAELRRLKKQNQEEDEARTKKQEEEEARKKEEAMNAAVQSQEEEEGVEVPTEEEPKTRESKEDGGSNHNQFTVDPPLSFIGTLLNTHTSGFGVSGDDDADSSNNAPVLAATQVGADEETPTGATREMQSLEGEEVSEKEEKEDVEEVISQIDVEEEDEQEVEGKQEDEETTTEGKPKFLLRFVNKAPLLDGGVQPSQTFFDSEGRPLPNLPLASVREANNLRNRWSLVAGDATVHEHDDACDEEAKALALLQENLDCMVPDDNGRSLHRPLLNPNPFYPCGDNEEHILPELRRRTRNATIPSPPRRTLSAGGRSGAPRLLTGGMGSRSVTPTAADVIKSLGGEQDAAAGTAMDREQEEEAPVTRPVRAATGHDLTPLTLTSIGVVPRHRQSSGSGGGGGGVLTARSRQQVNRPKRSDELRALLDNKAPSSSGGSQNGVSGKRGGGYQVPWYNASQTSDTPYLTDIFGAKK